MRQCDIHHLRSIKTNSDVNLSHKPAQGLCCDLLQDLKGLLRIVLVFTLSHDHFARSIAQVVFDMTYNKI